MIKRLPLVAAGLLSLSGWLYTTEKPVVVAKAPAIGQHVDRAAHEERREHAERLARQDEQDRRREPRLQLRRARAQLKLEKVAPTPPPCWWRPRPRRWRCANWSAAVSKIRGLLSVRART